ncbi:MAG: hypothetical protein ACFB50_09540 [Rubrobacteraceae bacterium]
MLAALLLAVGCSQEDTTELERTREFVEGTLSLPEAPEPTEGDPVSETTAGAQPDLLLRLEGDPKVVFSGICTSGSEDSVIGGRVPKLYRFELNEQRLSCRIQKRDPGTGSLRVVLLAGGETRSVQQTASREQDIQLSYAGN